MKQIFTAFFLLAFCSLASAATFTVNTAIDTLDISPGDGICADVLGACSLRAAIGEANALTGANTIVLPAGTYTQTLAAPNDDANLGGDWDITSVVTILGTGEFSCTLQAAPGMGQATERVINVRSGGDLTLSRVMVRNGRFSGAMTPETRGAGIENLGVLTLDHVIVRDNEVTSANGDPYGAGIHNAGTSMNLISSAITGNTISRQAGGNAFGGGIASTSEATITVTGGYIGNNNAFANGGSAFGSGMHLENRFTVSMSGCAVAHNAASGTAGVRGAGVSAISNSGTAVFSASGCTFRNNSGSGSTGGTGVGLFFLTTGTSANTLTADLNHISVKDNIGTSSGVGVGGQINGGNLTLRFTNSSITNNLGGVVGGGIFLTDAGPGPAGLALVDLKNTTVSRNSANNTGGGLALQGTFTAADLNHATIVGNTANNCGGICSAGGTLNIKNSIVAGNTGGVVPDVAGTIVSGDYNHFESISGATIIGSTANNATGEAGLGSLVEHVGGTVHMPGPKSPVLDSIPIGTNDCGTSILTDQRGARRPQFGGCDKGAVERVAFVSIGGQVRTSDGRGIRNAIITVSGGGLPQPLITQTGSFGWYYLPNLPGEQTYTVTVSARRYDFPFGPGPERSIYLFADTFNLDFVGTPGVPAQLR